jgi:predicted Zn-dependent peptidase
LTGTPENVRRFTRDDLLGFKDRWYGPRATVVSFAGQVDHEQCVQEVEDRLSWNGRQRKGRYPVVDRSTGQLSVDVIQKDIEQTHLAMGFRVFGRHDPRRYALKILSVILGENMSSRLFQVVREKHGMAYAVHSSIHLYEDTGALVISAGLDRARGAKALELIIRELVRLKERPVGAQELRRAKDYAIGHLMIGLESSSSQMLWLGENLISYNRIRQPDFIIDRLERTTREDIQKLAGQILKAARVSLSMVTPDAERYPADACKETVRALSGVK